jgi:hypothetical protein
LRPILKNTPRAIAGNGGKRTADAGVSEKKRPWQRMALPGWKVGHSLSQTHTTQRNDIPARRSQPELADIGALGEYPDRLDVEASLKQMRIVRNYFLPPKCLIKRNIAKTFFVLFTLKERHRLHTSCSPADLAPRGTVV